MVTGALIILNICLPCPLPVGLVPSWPSPHRPPFCQSVCLRALLRRRHTSFSHIHLFARLIYSLSSLPLTNSYVLLQSPPSHCFPLFSFCCLFVPRSLILSIASLFIYPLPSFGFCLGLFFIHCSALRGRSSEICCLPSSCNTLPQRTFRRVRVVFLRCIPPYNILLNLIIHKLRSFVVLPLSLP